MLPAQHHLRDHADAEHDQDERAEELGQQLAQSGSRDMRRYCRLVEPPTPMPYILALDQGTTSSRAIVFDHDGAIRAVAQKEFTQIFPQPAGSSTIRRRSGRRRSASPSKRSAARRLRPSDIAAIGITNQRETTIVWDRETGEPVYNAIVWQDRRTADFCERLKADGAGATIQAKTGLLIDAYFSASKIRWILDNVPGARATAPTPASSPSAPSTPGWSGS